MYGQEADLIREVIQVFNLNWPQIQFVAAHGVPVKDLGVWRAEAEEEHEARQEEFAAQNRRYNYNVRPFEVSGQPVRFSKPKLVKFYRAYEKAIWDSAYEFITSTEQGDFGYFEALGKCIGKNQEIESLNDVAAAAAAWAIAEVCGRVYADYESNNEAEGEKDYSEFRDIWEPPPEHEDVHTDTGFHEESTDAAIMRRLKSER